MATLISRSQTAFSSIIFGREEKGSGERPSYSYNFCSQNPHVLGIL